MNQLAYGPSGTINGMTANVTDLGALRIRSDALEAGKGLKWPLGTLKPGTYLLTESSGNLTDDNVYIAIFDQAGNRRQLVDAKNLHDQRFALREATDCTLAVYGKAMSTGKPCDIVLMPMLTDVNPKALVWQPPATLDAKAIGGVLNVNLLRNPSFETTGGWTGGEIELTKNQWYKPHDGLHVMIVKDKCSSDPVDVTGMKQLELTIWTNHHEAWRTMTVYAVFDGGTPVEIMQPVPDGQDWVRTIARFDVPDGAHQLNLRFSTSSWVRLDDLTLTEAQP